MVKQKKKNQKNLLTLREKNRYDNLNFILEIWDKPNSIQIFSISEIRDRLLKKNLKVTYPTIKYYIQILISNGYLTETWKTINGYVSKGYSRNILTNQ